MLFQTSMLRKAVYFSCLLLLLNFDLGWAKSKFSIPAIQLKNACQEGQTMPAIGLGLGAYGQDRSVGYGGYPECASEEDGCGEFAKRAVREWLSLGGRRLDMANDYGNDASVGEVLQASNISREELFILEKVGPRKPLGFADALEQFEEIRRNLGVDYVDLLLIHWPDHKETDIVSQDPACNRIIVDKQTGKTEDNEHYNPRLCRLNTWRALVLLHQQGRAKAIGVSNYQAEHLQEIVDENERLARIEAGDAEDEEECYEFETEGVHGKSDHEGGSEKLSKCRWKASLTGGHNGDEDEEARKRAQATDQDRAHRSERLPMPAVNQIPFHLYHNAHSPKRRAVMEFCRRYGIVVNGYSPFGVPDKHRYPSSKTTKMAKLTFQDYRVVEIANRLRRTPAQVLLQWQWAQGIPVNPRSQNKQHMRENLCAFHKGSLDADDIAQLDSAPQDYCAYDPDWYQCVPDAPETDEEAGRRTPQHHRHSTFKQRHERKERERREGEREEKGHGESRHEVLRAKEQAKELMEEMETLWERTSASWAGDHDHGHNHDRDREHGHHSVNHRDYYEFADGHEVHLDCRLYWTDDDETYASASSSDSSSSSSSSSASDIHHLASEQSQSAASSSSSTSSSSSSSPSILSQAMRTASGVMQTLATDLVNGFAAVLKL